MIVVFAYPVTMISPLRPLRSVPQRCKDAGGFPRSAKKARLEAGRTVRRVAALLDKLEHKSGDGARGSRFLAA